MREIQTRNIPGFQCCMCYFSTSRLYCGICRWCFPFHVCQSGSDRQTWAFAIVHKTCRRSKSLSCILSLHIGRNKVWPFPRQHSLGVLHPAHGQAACLTPLLQEGTASLEQELVLTFSELPTNCCCLTACTTSSLLPLSCVVYCIFSLVLTYCCFISLFSYLFFFFSPDSVQFSCYSYFCFLSLSISLSCFTAFCPKS